MQKENTTDMQIEENEKTKLNNIVDKNNNDVVLNQIEAPQTKKQQESSFSKTMKKVFTTKMLVFTAVFSALSFVVSLLEFPIFPATSFLKMDFSLVFPTLAGFAFGPVSGILVSLVKESLSILKSSTGGIGELANFIVTVSYIIVPSIVYRYRKGIKTVLLTLSIGCVLEICLAVLSNRFILFPLYKLENMFSTFVWYLVGFNAIKIVSISILTMILYKRISFLIKKF